MNPIKSGMQFQKKGRLGLRLFLIVLVGATGLAFALGASNLIIGAVSAYDKYVNRPDLNEYTSHIGSMTFTYPTAMIVEDKMYGDSLESIYIKPTYNASILTDGTATDLRSLSFRFSIHGATQLYRSIDETASTAEASFRKVYFYEDESDPKKLEREEKYSVIERINETREIAGRPANYFEVKETPRDSETKSYNRRVFALFSFNGSLFEIDAKISVNKDRYSEAAISRANSALDSIIASIRLGGTK